MSAEEKNPLHLHTHMADMFADEDSARFFQIVQMLQRSTMLHMGFLPDQENAFHYNLLEAKY